MNLPSRSLPPVSSPIPALSIVTETWFEFPESYSKFPLAIYFTYVSVYVSTLLSSFVPLSPSYPSSLCSLCLHLHSVQFSCSIMSDSFWPYGLQHARLPCPSPTPRACSNSSIESVMPSSHFILCGPLLLLPPIPPSIRVSSNESVLQHLHCCPANRFVSTIFLNSISEHILLTQSFSFMKKYLAKWG